MSTNTKTLPKYKELAQKLLKEVRSPLGQGVFASGGPKFSDAVFGRDSIEVAEDLLYIYPELSKEIILTLCALQGTKLNNLTEEEPGKIHHEHRSIAPNPNHRPSQTSIEIFHQLSDHWGFSGNTFTYYGAVDATPLFVRLVEQYVDKYGKNLLFETIIDKDGNEQTVRDCAERALQWIHSKINESKSGLIEYYRQNPNGLINQVWKDSNTSYMFSNGSLTRLDKPVAACEVQAYAYDALAGAQTLLLDRKVIKQHQQAAKKLKDNTLNLLWLKPQQNFAMGLTYNTTGDIQQIDVPSSNAALMLDSTILGKSEQSQIHAVAKRIVQDDFATPAGIRCRSVYWAHFEDVPQYHGAYAVWPKETSDIARGLLKHGYTQEAQMLFHALVTNLNIYKGFSELFWVPESGEVIDPKHMNKARNMCATQSNAHLMDTPMYNQAWTISAYIQALHQLEISPTDAPAA